MRSLREVLVDLPVPVGGDVQQPLETHLAVAAGACIANGRGRARRTIRPLVRPTPASTSSTCVRQVAGTVICASSGKAEHAVPLRAAAHRQQRQARCRTASARLDRTLAKQGADTDQHRHEAKQGDGADALAQRSIANGQGHRRTGDQRHGTADAQATANSPSPCRHATGLRQMTGAEHRQQQRTGQPVALGGDAPGVQRIEQGERGRNGRVRTPETSQTTVREQARERTSSCASSGGSWRAVGVKGMPWREALAHVRRFKTRPQAAGYAPMRTTAGRA